MEPELESLLENSRNDLHDRNLVSFLGEVKSGKTVVSALLKHALFNYFIPNSKGKYEGIVSGGQDIINHTLGDMIKDGLFPPSTWPIDRRVVSLDVFTTKGKGPGKVELILRDMSGEDFVDLLTREYTQPEERLQDILTFNKDDAEPYGPLAHLVFAKMYVILIDCSKNKTWNHEQSYAAGVINALREIKELAKDVHNGKIYNPIAIIFTKSDLLDPKEQSTPPEKLMEKMPEFVSALKVCHNGPVNYFKMSVDVDKESKKDIEDRIKRECKKAEESYEKQEIERKEKIDDELTDIYDTAKQKALDEGKNEDQSTEEANQVKESQIQEINLKYPESEFTFDETKYSEPQDKVKTPLKYTNSEYVKLISWILQNFTR